MVSSCRCRGDPGRWCRAAAGELRRQLGRRLWDLQAVRRVCKGKSTKSFCYCLCVLHSSASVVSYEKISDAASSLLLFVERTRKTGNNSSAVQLMRLKQVLRGVSSHSNNLDEDIWSHRCPKWFHLTMKLHISHIIFLLFHFPFFFTVTKEVFVSCLLSGSCQNYLVDFHLSGCSAFDGSDVCRKKYLPCSRFCVQKKMLVDSVSDLL